jgi:hypothetical protein
MEGYSRLLYDTRDRRDSGLLRSEPTEVECFSRGCDGFAVVDPVAEVQRSR